MTAIGEMLFDERTIEQKIAELGARISNDYAGKELVLVCVLKGAALFTADLLRSITIPVTTEYLQAASYGSGTMSSCDIVIQKDIEGDIRGKHVLLADTIIDSGRTMACLFNKFSEQEPASLNAVVLLDKSSKRTVAVPIAYKGFEIADQFVVGYGMDCGEKYRNLPYIAMLTPSR